MSEQPDIERGLAARLRVMRIIVVALAIGIVNFVGIAVYVVRVNGAPANVPFAGISMTQAALIFAAVLFLAHLIVPPLVEAAMRKRIARGIVSPVIDRLPPLPGDLGPLAGLYQTRLIVSEAMLEAPAFFALIAYLVEGQTAMLIVASVFLLLLLSKFPTMAGLQAWLERQQELLVSERQG